MKQSLYSSITTGSQLCHFRGKPKKKLANFFPMLKIPSRRSDQCLAWFMCVLWHSGYLLPAHISTLQIKKSYWRLDTVGFGCQARAGILVVFSNHTVVSHRSKRLTKFGAFSKYPVKFLPKLWAHSDFKLYIWFPATEVLYKREGVLFFKVIFYKQVKPGFINYQLRGLDNQINFKCKKIKD